MMEEEKKVIDLKPLGKWRRILLFLGDFFISFIISFFLFNVAIYPLGTVIGNTNQRTIEAVELENKATNLLIDSGILFQTKDSDVSFENDVDYTFKLFLSYYAFDDEVVVGSTDSQYGHKIENEVIRTYFVNILDDETRYLAAFNEVNKSDQMFVIGDNKDSISLKDDYKTLLGNELLEVTDESKYSKSMQNFRDHVFGQLFYIHVYKDIQKVDYFKDGISFNTCMNKAESIYRSLQWVPVICSFISLIIGWSLVYILYPMLNKDDRTMTMSVMKIDRIDFRTLNSVPKFTLIINSIYSLIFCFTYILFLPSLYCGISYVFNLPLLFIFSAIGLLFVLLSLIVLLFNQFNRSGSDVLTYEVVLPTSEIDNLYKERLDEGRLSD